MERAKAIWEELGLSEFAVGCGFNYIEEDELPESLSPDELVKVG